MATNGHGGARPGAGRPPKALHYAAQLAEAEGKIIAALPEIIDGLVTAAKAGDVAAAKYLLDRVFGRPKEMTCAPAEDTSLPYDEEEHRLALRDRETTNLLRGVF